MTQPTLSFGICEVALLEMKTYREPWISTQVQPEWRRCASPPGVLPGSGKPPSSGLRGEVSSPGCQMHSALHFINMLPSPSFRSWRILLTFKHDTERWMLITKGFLIKFNGVGHREVVLAVSILLKMLIVTLREVGKGVLTMTAASEFLFGSCCL